MTLTPRSKKPRAWLTGIATLSIASLALTACGGGGSDGGDQVAATAKQKITFWTWAPTPEQFAVLQKQFAKEYPDTTIEWNNTADLDAYKKKLQVALAGGEGPDLFGVQTGSMLEEYSRFTAPMSTLADQYMAGWKDKITAPAVTEATTSKGTLSAMPVIGAGMEYYLYNKTLMKEAGITDLPKTYADLKADSAILKSKGLLSMAMGAKDGWHNEDFFVWLSQQYGAGDIYKAQDAQLPWTSKSLADTMTAWKALFTDGVFQKGALGVPTYPDARDSYFYSRKSAFFPTGSWHVSATITNPETPGTKVEKDELGMAAFPQIGPLPAKATTGVDLAFAVNKTSKHQAAAMSFVKFMTLGAGQQTLINTLQGSPVNKDDQAQLPADASATAKESVSVVTTGNKAAIYPRKLKYPELDTAIQVALQEVVTGKSVADALADIQKVSDGITR